MMRMILVGLSLALGACSTASQLAPRETVRYQEVKTPVATSCVPPELSQAPSGLETRETLAALPSGPLRYARVTADDLARMARMQETEAVIDKCRRAPP
jgi:hypothetical protein